MSDNTTIPVGAGGDTISTIDRSLNVQPTRASKTQIVQFDIGGESIESLATASNPLPMQESVLQGLMQQQLIMLKCCHMLLQHIAGITVSPSEVADDSYIN